MKPQKKPRIEVLVDDSDDVIVEWCLLHPPGLTAIIDACYTLYTTKDIDAETYKKALGYVDFIYGSIAQK